MKKINVKKMFDFFVFLNLFTLCCDADNNFVFYFSLIGLIFTALIRGKIEKRIFFSETNMWNYLFGLYAALSVLWSISYIDSKAMVYVFIRRTVLILSLTIFVRDIKDVKKILLMYLICNFCMMIKISYRFEMDYAGAKTWDVITGNYFNTVAQFLAIGIIIAYYFFETTENKHIKRFCLIFIIFAFYHIYLTGSRKGLVIPIVEFVIYRIITSGFKIEKIIKNILVFGCGGAVIVVFLILNPEVYERLKIVANMFLTGANGDESTMLRQYYIELAKKMFIDSPIVGQGINTFPYVLNMQHLGYKYCHNNFYEILSGTGVIGVVLYYWFYAKLLWKLYKTRRNKINVMGFSIILTLLVFEYGIVTYSVYMYPIIFAILSVLCVTNNEERKGEEIV